MIEADKLDRRALELALEQEQARSRAVAEAHARASDLLAEASQAATDAQERAGFLEARCESAERAVGWLGVAVFALGMGPAVELAWVLSWLF